MPKYELVVVYDATRSEEEQSKALDALEAIITDNGGTVEKRDIWGKRRLAYAIGKRREGFYALILFNASTGTAVLSELSRSLRIDEAVLRWLITKAVVGKSSGTPLDPEKAPRFAFRGGGRHYRAPGPPPPREDWGVEKKSEEKPESAEDQSDAESGSESTVQAAPSET